MDDSLDISGSNRHKNSIEVNFLGGRSVWAAGQGFGALNEVIEFSAVLAVPETNVGGYANTGWDLVANLVGCSVAVLWIRFDRAI